MKTWIAARLLYGSSKFVKHLHGLTWLLHRADQQEWGEGEAVALLHTDGYGQEVLQNLRTANSN